jgi:hypothetical protein
LNQDIKVHKIKKKGGWGESDDIAFLISALPILMQQQCKKLVLMAWPHFSYKTSKGT